jgi:hypothetical protein
MENEMRGSADGGESGIRCCGMGAEIKEGREVREIDPTLKIFWGMIMSELSKKSRPAQGII